MADANVHATAQPRKSRIHHITTFKDRDEWLELLFAADVSPAAKVAGGRIALHHNIKTGQCNPTIGTLMLGTLMSDSSVRRAIRELETKGWVRVDRTLGRHSNSYELLAPTLSCVTGFNPTKDDRVEASNPTADDRVQEKPTLSPVTPQPCQIEVPNPVTIDRQNHESRTTNRTTKEIDPPALDLGDEGGRRRKQKTAPDSTDADFEEWWLAYPKKVANLAAKKAYSGAVKNGAAPEQLLSGAMRYAAERSGQDPRYTKNPGTWLNGGCWADEPAKPAGNTIDQNGNPVTAPPPNQQRQPYQRESTTERMMRKMGGGKWLTT